MGSSHSSLAFLASPRYSVDVYHSLCLISRRKDTFYTFIQQGKSCREFCLNTSHLQHLCVLLNYISVPFNCTTFYETWKKEQNIFCYDIINNFNKNNLLEEYMKPLLFAIMMLSSLSPNIYTVKY